MNKINKTQNQFQVIRKQQPIKITAASVTPPNTSLKK